MLVPASSTVLYTIPCKSQGENKKGLHKSKIRIKGGINSRIRIRIKMAQQETKRCIGCEEVKPVTEFYRNPTGKPKAHCKVCMKEYERIRYADRAKTREIIQENKDFFQLGATRADDHIRDLQKALNIAQKTIKALVDVIKDADLRDLKQGRISA